MTDERETALRRVLAEVERGWADQVEHLRRLVREPSTLGNEAGAQRVMAATFRELGLRVTTFEPDVGTISSLRGYSPVEWSYRGRPNVVGVLSAPRPRGRSLVLNGHVDVVSAEPIDAWSRDPFGGELVGDRLYGRGACDMKAGLGALAHAIRAIRAAGVELAGEVVLESVIEEECTGNGTLACLARGFRGDGCLIPEPIDGEALVAQIGLVWCRVKVRGRAAHMTGAAGAANAIEKTYLVIQGMRALEARLNEPGAIHPAFADVPHPVNFNPGVIRGGDWPSTVPALCELEFRMAFCPGTTVEEAKARIRETIAAAAAADPWLAESPPEVSFFGFHAEGTALPPHGVPIVELLDSAHERVTGRRLGRRAMAATTDCRHFILNEGIPATSYGPRGGGWHGTDEYVELESVLEATKVIAAFVLDWCGYWDGADLNAPLDAGATGG